MIRSPECAFSAEKLDNAQIKRGGPWVGWDGKSHTLFRLQAEGCPELYGEYIMAWAPNGNDFNLEFGLFGFLDKIQFANPDPAVREHFTPEEAESIERRLRVFAQDLVGHFEKRPSRGRFLGNLTFRPGWLAHREPS